MTNHELKKEAHDVDVTVWVGKSGPNAALEELKTQLQDRKLVKVKFHRSSQAGTTVAEMAAELADKAGAEVVDTRGNTAVFH